MWYSYLLLYVGKETYLNEFIGTLTVYLLHARC